MKSSERILIKRRITETLSKEGWSIIDLTLREFGLPTSEMFSGTNTEYILSMLTNSDDATLQALLDHLGRRQADEPQTVPVFWKPRCLRLFISHIHKHKKFAKALQDELISWGISAFVAHEDVEPLKEWQDEIEAALRTMDALMALITPGFVESKWTDQEVGFGFGRNVLLIPVKLGVDPHGFLGKYQALTPASESAGDLAASIYKHLLADNRTSQVLSDAIAYQLAEAGSFAAAKRTMALLERCTTLSAPAIKELNEVALNNSQVKEAFGIEVRLKKYLKKISS